VSCSSRSRFLLVRQLPSCVVAVAIDDPMDIRPVGCTSCTVPSSISESEIKWKPIVNGKQVQSMDGGLLILSLRIVVVPSCTSFETQ
jgi:hypothetical protein